MRSLVGAVLVILTAGLLAPAVAADESTGTPTATQAAAPALRVTRIATGLNQPWDVQQIDRRRFLVTERDTRRLLLVHRDGRVRTVRFPSHTVWSSGETGLMSIALDPRFGKHRRFHTCHGGFTPGGGHDVRVVTWRLGSQLRRARKVRTLLTGIQATSGRHGGCRLLRHGKKLFVGTGDAAVGSNPRDLTSLNGKVLRLDRRTGAPWPRNPWAEAANVKQRYVFTYGHRNVQGLARRGDGSTWSVEHGPNRDDEVNRLGRGHDHGWHPVPSDASASGYDESVPMTDHALPGRQHDARWRSGSSTLATSGAVWVKGRKWGSYRRMLAVAALKGSRVVLMRFDADGHLVSTVAPPSLQSFGRLRSISRAKNNDLLITTANGADDAVLRVRPVS